jgi:hypothetical protein
MRRYGASRWHLLAHLAALAAIAYALYRLLDPRFTHPLNFAAWFVGGALVHDLAFLPLYALLDGLGRLAVPAVNHVRVPAVICGVLFVVYFPLILGDGRENYVRAAGHAPPDYLARWLGLCALAFGLSALVYLARAARASLTAGR